MAQFNFHKMPKDSKVCDVCGCSGVKPGVWHKALTADEAFEHGAQYVKRVKVCFGTDWSVEKI